MPTSSLGPRSTSLCSTDAAGPYPSTPRDDYHCIEDTGFIELFGKNAQAAADLNIIAHWIAEPRACR